MLCPCCGGEMPLGASSCSCGARIVGDPLPESPFKVARLGPVMTAVATTIVIAASCRISLWLALGALPAAWLAWRALKLAKADPERYGGYRVARATLAIILVVGCSLGTCEISRIPRYLDNRRAVKTAATQAVILHVAGVLEDYKQKNGSLPANKEALMKIIGDAMPVDYWQQPILYRSYDESAAVFGDIPRIEGAGAGSGGNSEMDGDSPVGDDSPGIEFHSFELRSPGPDGILGTADDIVMLDGVFCTNPRVLKHPVDKNPSDR
jgi:hypothetical protein